jgi:hypothetical protein
MAISKNEQAAPRGNAICEINGMVQTLIPNKI